MKPDINCDMGEGMGNDELIMPFINSANIACGYHAGDVSTIKEAIVLCIKYGVSIGAHPSFYDRQNFGRKEMNLPADELYELVMQQLIIFSEVASLFDVKINHVKPHGALYNMAAKDASIAHVIAKAICDFDNKLLLVGLSGSHSITQAHAVGLRTNSEVFADRTYQEDGSLTPRSQQGSIIESKDEAMRQILQMTNEGKVTTATGKTIPILAETICLHGDGKHAVEFAESIYKVVNQ